jgi:hypothetical protein
MSEPIRVTFRVGTTYDGPQDAKPIRHWVRSYTRFYGLEWPGLIEYDVEASMPEEARLKARELRFMHECAKYVGAHP